jgi:hypothetical protein
MNTSRILKKSLGYKPFESKELGRRREKFGEKN